LLAADPSGDPGGLVLMGLDGSFQSRLTGLQGSVAFGWSASGDHLAYVTAPGPTGALHGDLVIVNVENPSQPARVVYEANGVTAFMWAQARERLAYYVPTLPPNGQDQRISTSAQQQRLFLDLFIYDVEQDESKLVASFLPTREFLEILPFFDQYQRSITFWSPDAESFVFSAELAGGASAIYTVEVSGPAAPVELAPGSLAFWSMD
jgi:Tol biopolymer transport system component